MGTTPTSSYGPVDPTAPFPQAPQPKKSHKLRNGIIGGIALLALVGGCTALSGGGSDNAAQIGSEPMASAPAKAPSRGR
jgi:hypothetical protein